MPIPKIDLNPFNGVSDGDAEHEGAECEPAPEPPVNEGCEVVRPDHYTVGGYEALDVIRAKLTPEEYRGYCKGNVLKYLMRANYKGHHDTDCRKAEFYSDELVKSLKHREVQHGTKEQDLDEVPF